MAQQAHAKVQLELKKARDAEFAHLIRQDLSQLKEKAEGEVSLGIGVQRFC